jgi:hypothetical protein
MSLFGRTSLAAVLAVLVVLGPSESQAGIDVGSNGESHDSTWKAADVDLYLDSSLNELSGASASVALALATWDTDSRLPHVSLLAGKADAVGYREGQTNRSTVRFMGSGAAIAKGALAITEVSYDAETDAIVDGDIILNGIYTFGNLRQTSALPCSGKKAVYDLTDVLTHELGHWFGLPDNPGDPHALMYPNFGPNETRTLVLAESDLQAVNQLYSSASASNQSKASCSISMPSRGHHSYALLTIALMGFWVARCKSSAAYRFRE